MALIVTAFWVTLIIQDKTLPTDWRCSMKKNAVFAFVIIITIILFLNSGCKEKNLEQLLEMRKYNAAEKYCEKREGEEKKKCCKTIAAYYYQDDLFEKAALFYDKAGEPVETVKCFWQGNLVAEAEEYCKKQSGEIKKQCAANLAGKFYYSGNPAKAVDYYQMAEDTQMIAWVQGRTPVFQLVETIETDWKTIDNPDIRSLMKAISKALGSYIYMEKYFKWPYGEETESDRQAAVTCEKAIRLMDEEAAPLLMEKIKSIAAGSQWTKENLESLSFPRARLESLTKLVQYLHNIARYRGFFLKYTEGTAETPAENANVNYAAAYNTALKRAGGLIETVELAGGVTDGKQLKVYEEDLSIDLTIIDYISSMMDNLEIRIGDIQTRGKQYRRYHNNAASKEKSEKLSGEFIILCNRVLQAIGKEEFQEANDLLVNGYESAKNELTVKTREKTTTTR